MATNNKAQLSNNNLIVVMILITVIVVIAAAIATKTIVGQISLNMNVIKAKNTADKQGKADVQAAPNLVNAYNNLGSQAQLLADALPTSVDFPTLMVEMENISNAAGMQLKSIAPATTSTDGATPPAPAAPSPTTTPSTTTTPTGLTAVTPQSPQEFDFTISLSGAYTNLLTVLQDLEQSARPMRVTGLLITGSGSSLTANVNVATYFQSPAQLPFGTETVK